MSSSSNSTDKHRRHRARKHADRRNSSSEDEYLLQQPSTSSTRNNTTTNCSSVIADRDHRVRVEQRRRTRSPPAGNGCSPELIAHKGQSIGSGVASVVSSLFRSSTPTQMMPARGMPGPMGLPGEPGPQGERGERGPRGLPGQDGKDGKPGNDGRDGRRGPRGFNGVKGDKGETGHTGEPGRDGRRGPRGPPGVCVCNPSTISHFEPCDDDQSCEPPPRKSYCENDDEDDCPTAECDDCGSSPCDGSCQKKRKKQSKKDKYKKKSNKQCQSSDSECDDLPTTQCGTIQFCASSCKESHSHRYRRCNNLKAHGDQCNCGESSTDAWQNWNNTQHANATTALTAATLELQQLLRQFPLLAQSLNLGGSCESKAKHCPDISKDQCKESCKPQCDPKSACDKEPCNSNRSDDDDEASCDIQQPPPKPKCLKEINCNTCEQSMSQCECDDDVKKSQCQEDCYNEKACDDSRKSSKHCVDESLDWCSTTKCTPNRKENCCIVATSYYLDGGNATTTMFIDGFTSPTNAQFRKDTLLLTSTSPVIGMSSTKAVYIQVLIPGIYTVSYSVNFIFTQPDQSMSTPASVANFTTGVIISDGSVDPAALGNIGTVNAATGVSVASLMKFTSPVTLLTLRPTYLVVHNTFTLDFTTAGVHNISYPFIGLGQSLGGNGDLTSTANGPPPLIDFVNVNMTVVRQDLDNTTPTRITYPMVQQIGCVLNSQGVTINGPVALNELNQLMFGFAHAMNACGTVIAIAHLTGVFIYQTCGRANQWRYFQSLTLPVGYAFSPTAWDFIDLNADGTTLAVSALTVPTVQTVVPEVVGLVYTRCSRKQLFTAVPVVLHPPSVTTTPGVQGALTIADNTGRLAFANMGVSLTAGNFSGAVFVYRNIASSHSTPNFIQEQTLMPADLINSTTGTMFGNALEFSCNANTLSIGAPGDGTNGATFIYNRSGTTWTELTKLSDTAAVVGAQQGFSTDITDDGLVIVSGVPMENAGIGEVQIYTRLNVTDVPTLSQTISGSNSVGLSHQGQAVAITGDGRFIAIGGPDDNAGLGAVWIFANNTGSFTDKVKLPLPSGFVGTGFGRSLQWSADGLELSIGSNGSGVFVYVNSN